MGFKWENEDWREAYLLLLIGESDFPNCWLMSLGFHGDRKSMIENWQALASLRPMSGVFRALPFQLCCNFPIDI